jgi:predicted dienelactone hydrolase
MRIYITGPMSGLPEFNYPAFHAADAALKALGHETLNPANNPECDSWEGYMRAAIAQVIQAEAIAFLPGSDSSRGALLELKIGEELGLYVCSLDWWLS